MKAPQLPKYILMALFVWSERTRSKEAHILSCFQRDGLALLYYFQNGIILLQIDYEKAGTDN